MMTNSVLLHRYPNMNGCFSFVISERPKSRNERSLHIAWNMKRFVWKSYIVRIWKCVSARAQTNCTYESMTRAHVPSFHAGVVSKRMRNDHITICFLFFWLLFFFVYVTVEFQENKRCKRILNTEHTEFDRFNTIEIISVVIKRTRTSNNRHISRMCLYWNCHFLYPSAHTHTHTHSNYPCDRTIHDKCIVHFIARNEIATRPFFETPLMKCKHRCFVFVH